MERIWRKGILGVVVGDALGCPVQFEGRDEVARHPVTGMRGYGTFGLPEGSWTDDSSLTLALLDSINEKNDIDLNHIMHNFVDWLEDGKYTPYGQSYDIGYGTMKAIKRYEYIKDPNRCGGDSEDNNGNGSLMRIMPCCLYCVEKGFDDDKAIEIVHSVSALTHAHIRSKIACGIYYFLVRAIINKEGTLKERMSKGMTDAMEYYDAFMKYDEELNYYNRIAYINAFVFTPREYIKSSGYVVDSLEAAIWSLITTNSYKDALLKAVNLGGDTDTIGAIASGLGALYYGIGGEKGVPQEWINAIKRLPWIEEMCEIADERYNQHTFVAQ